MTAPEPTAEGIGAGFSWAVTSLRSNLASLIGITALVAAIEIAAFFIAYIVLRVVEELDVGPVTLAGVWLAIIVVFLAAAFIWSALFRAWHMIALGNKPDLKLVFALDRIPQAAMIMVLLLPILIIPITGGFAIVAFYYVAGQELSPTTAFAQMIDRCTASARAFWGTILIGFLISLYGFALVFLISFIANFNASITVVNSFENYFDSGSGLDSDLTLVLGFIALALIAIPLYFLLIQIPGLWGVAWARRLLDRENSPQATPDNQF